MTASSSETQVRSFRDLYDRCYGSRCPLDDAAIRRIADLLFGLGRAAVVADMRAVATFDLAA